MEKVKVNKEIFDALESFVKRGKDLKSELNYDVCTNYFLKDNELILRGLNCRTLVDIAYCGYELEETKEEKLLKEFVSNSHNKSYSDGIKNTLDILNIEIEGINK